MVGMQSARLKRAGVARHLLETRGFSRVRLHEQNSGFGYWHISKLGEINEYFKQQDKIGWKEIKFPECFTKPEVIKMRGRKTNSNIT
ncbi:MAG: hypothetical protein ACI4TA_06705 [Acetatifactor sp.]